MRFVLVEATGRILPEVGEDLGRYTVEQLRKRGIDVRLNTRLESCVGGHIVLSDGEEFDAETLVWTAGVKASPMLARHRPAARRQGPAALPSRPARRGRRRRLGGRRRRGRARPDRTARRRCAAPSAQHAVRQAKVLGDNIALVLHGRTPRSYSAQARRLGGVARPAQGRRAGLRHQAARASRRGSCTGPTT